MPPAVAHLVVRNRILADLDGHTLARLRADMQTVVLASGQVLHERGAAIEHVYFMESGLASLTAETFDMRGVEVGLAGREGFVGVAAMLQARPLSGQRAFIQIPGEALRLPRAAFMAACDASPELSRRCLAYIGTLMEQIAQTAACNARHSLTARLARWLLMSHDRIDGDVLPLTQEFLAYMLGVRRPGVSTSASALQSRGLIQCGRSRVVVVDRPGLEAAACSCYRLLKSAEVSQAA